MRFEPLALLVLLTTSVLDAQNRDVSASLDRLGDRNGRTDRSEGVTAQSKRTGIQLATDFNWSLKPSTDLTVPGKNTVSLSACPMGVNGSERHAGRHVAEMRRRHVHFHDRLELEDVKGLRRIGNQLAGVVRRPIHWIRPPQSLRQRALRQQRAGSEKLQQIATIGGERHRQPPSVIVVRISEVSLRLEIAGLRRRQWREFAAVGFEVEQRRLVETVEAAHQHDVTFDADQLDDRGADRIGAHGRAQRERAAGVFVVLRALQHQIAARLMQPVDHFEISNRNRHP